MRPFSRSASRTLTRTVSPTLAICEGRTPARCDSSLTCTMPSTPPRSTNTPKSRTLLTLPSSSSARGDVRPGLVGGRVALVLEDQRAGDHQGRQVVGKLGDAEQEALPEVGVDVAGEAEVDLRHRAERAQAGDRDVVAALVAAGHLAVDRDAVVVGAAQRLALAPLDGKLVRDAHLGRERDDDRVQAVARAELPELGAVHDRLGLAADGDESDVAVHGHDGAGDELTDLELFLLEGLRQGLGEALVVRGWVLLLDHAHILAAWSCSRRSLQG